MGWLRRLFFEDFWLKLVALVCALLLWFGMDEKLTEPLKKTVPVSRDSFPGVPQGWVVTSVTNPRGKPVSEVEVILRGSRRDFEGIEEVRLAVERQLSPEESPTVLMVALSAEDIRINKKGDRPRHLRVEFSHGVLHVRLERERRLQATVRPKIVDLEALREAGYDLIGGPEVAPATVDIFGPELPLRGAREPPIIIETEPVSVVGRRGPFQVSARLPHHGEIGSRRGRIEPKPSAVVVSGFIDLQPVEREVEDVPVGVRFLPGVRGSVSVRLEPQSIRVRVRGPESLVPRLGPADIIVWVNLTELPPGESEGALVPRIDLPEGTRLVGELPRISVKLAPAREVGPTPPAAPPGP